MTVSLQRIDGARRLVVSRVVDAPVEDVWDLFTDTERWHEWGPSVSDVTATDRYIQTGTTGEVRTPIGISVSFEITHCEPYRWTWTVARIPATGHRVDRITDDRCEAAFELSPLAAGYVPVCRRALERIADRTEYR